MTKDMKLDLEKGAEEGMDATAHQVPAMTKDEDEGDLLLELLRVHQAEGGTVADKKDPAQKKWGPAYWILVAAASVIVFAPTKPTKDQLFPPELFMFPVLLSAVCYILRTMKKMM
ncbi:unnamed protein product [Urochloa humidicola]